MPTDSMSAPERPAGLVLIGGPPGAGKSTVAALLADAADRPTVHLPTDSFYVWIRKGFVLPYLPAAERQNEVVSRAMVEAALAYACGGYEVVVEGILGPWSLAPFLAGGGREGIGVSYVVLRPSLEVTLARAKAREGRQLRDVEPIVGLYGAFTRLGGLEGMVVDSSGQSAEQTAEEVRAGLRDGRFALTHEA